jgi:hypothetical protein
MVPKSSKKYFCEKCDYSTSRHSQWVRHIATAKHTEDKKKFQKVPDDNPSEFVCECGNKYHFQSGLSKHKKCCVKLKQHIQQNVKQNISNYEEVVNSILQDNKELKQFILEQSTKMIELSSNNINANNINIVNNTTNNTTNNFNLQMFLNVQCKDAINISDFVDSIQVTLEDLENTGRLGYVEGISKIFLNGLKDMNDNDRPIHCSDQKRETFYIKDNNIWEKDNNNREKITLAIKKVASKNIKQIPLWQKANPDYFDSTSKKNDKYLKIVSNSMNGLTAEESQKNYDKIISRIAKEVTIKKT